MFCWDRLLLHRTEALLYHYGAAEDYLAVELDRLADHRALPRCQYHKD
jgi:hypothetical protein